MEVLGPLRAWRSGTPLDLGPVKRQAVLAALLLRPDAVVSHELLLDGVWGTQTPASGHKVLASHVNPLRRTLDALGTRPAESVIRSGKGWYRFVVDGVRLDTADLTERGDEALRTKASGDLAGATDQLSAALALFRGEPLANLPGPFAQTERQRLLERRRTLRLTSLECLVLLGRFGEALDDLAAPSASPSDPFDESLLALRMRALYGCERQAEALNTYQEMRVRLRDELGVDPGEELRRVYEAVLRQDDAYLLRPAAPPAQTLSEPIRNHPATAAPIRPGITQRSARPAGDSAPPSPAELPHDAAGFAGRTDELARLHALLPPDQGRGPTSTVVISAIGGAAGIGKTALAVHWAHQVRDRFPDGQLYVNLHGFDHDRQPLEPGEVLELLLRSLGLAASEIPANHEAQGRLYRTLLAGRRLLVLLDNAASAEQVHPLLPGSPSCCIVVTSRNRLGDLVARDGAHALPLDLLRPAEAHALLSAALGGDRLSAEPLAVDELIRLCGSLPLALRVAAARLAGDPGLRLADLVTEMSEGNRLEALEPDDDDNSPLRTAFSASYRVLAPAARRVFRLLGLFPGPELTAEVAAAFLDAPLPQARRLLSALAAAHLIEPATVGRYRFHDLLREYAQERARVEETAADRDTALRRVLIWYVHAARATSGTWFFPELPPDLVIEAGQPGMPSVAGATQWLEPERANLLAVINHAGRHGPRPVAWHLASALLGYFWLHLPRATWLATAQTALEAAAAEGDPFGEAAMHSSLGTARFDRGHARQALDHHARALAISRELGWATGEAVALGGRGFVEWSMARLDSAHEHLTTALRITRDAGNLHFEALGLVGLGWTCRDQGRLREAADHLELAIRRNEEIGWSDDNPALQNLGWVYWELGRLADGLDVLRPQVAAAERGGYRDDRAMMLDAVAKINIELGHHEEALIQAERAFAMVKDTRRWTKASILNTIAAAHRKLAHFDESLRADGMALASAREARFRRTEADSILGLSLTQKELGRHDQARRHAEQALILAREHGFRVVEGQALTVLCGTAESEAAYATAVTLGQEALAIHRETGHRLGEARTLMVLSRSLQKRKDAAAGPVRQQALDIFSSVGVPAEEYKDLDR
ncbi:BTAD domain-containing putative transcriptional regulator [Streptomyces mirabilis]|uniref:BTAD domain-containing putative transcriptional regulator n=1 Tax=Streptomyces mirabilis TaxID=68239 RepID=A0ABU3V610_9ACTN|nr:BTAD domain-containing putative transcriptional regulator [Streptomyces mirabilis]MCX5355583.1 tetratricopeptide repeat protein [Streptomyces mirabilis]MDU9001229.1 BTAD domain-containing putative transcriptional regulator [Streptomyces mirabilis]